VLEWVVQDFRDFSADEAWPVRTAGRQLHPRQAKPSWPRFRSGKPNASVGRRSAQPHEPVPSRTEPPDTHLRRIRQSCLNSRQKPRASRQPLRTAARAGVPSQSIERTKSSLSRPHFSQ